MSVTLFDIALQSRSLSEADLRRLRFFDVRGALVAPEISSFRLSVDSLESTGLPGSGEETEVSRLRRAGLKAFASIALPDGVSVGGELEQGLQRLTPLLDDSQVVAVGPCVARGTAAEEHVFSRQAELARDLHRPFLAMAPPRAQIREVRRLLSLLREGGLAPERTLLLGLPWASLRLGLEYGYSVALSLSGGRQSGTKLLELVSRLGGQRLLIGSGGGDFLAVPKAAAALEEGKVPRSVRRRLLWSNAVEFLRVEEAVKSEAT
jgi:predicted metal-dependent TIM-barrel fold hydrolase